MKILKFQAENIKGIRAVEIIPGEEIVTISGANGAGKSSVLDTIEALLCGGDLPLKNGADKGKAEINLGDYVISRIITEKTDRLIVKNKDGAQYPSPREFLSKIVGNLSIDPLSFIRLKDKEQIEVIFRLIPHLEKSLNEINTRITGMKEERSFLLKTGQKLKVQLEAMVSKYDATVPKEPLSAVDLYKELSIETAKVSERSKIVDEVKNIEASRDRLFNEKTATEKYIQMLEEKLSDSMAKLEAKTKELESITNKVIELNKSLELIPEESREKEILAKIEQIQAINSKVAVNKTYEAKQAEKDKTAEAWLKLGEDIKAQEAEKLALLSRDVFLPGLSVQNGEVVFNHVPIRDLSTSEKIRVGAAIAVAQAPNAKIILVDDISLLDNENLKILHEKCAGFQIWQVVNDTSGNLGFYIEAGEIKRGADAAKD